MITFLRVEHIVTPRELQKGEKSVFLPWWSAHDKRMNTNPIRRVRTTQDGSILQPGLHQVNMKTNSQICIISLLCKKIKRNKIQDKIW